MDNNNLHEKQQEFLECFRIASEFCGKTNTNSYRYNFDDVTRFAMHMAKTIGIIVVDE